MTASLVKHGIRVLLADDLTGACDTGVKFLVQGSPTYVSLYNQPLSAPQDSTQVICTLSRSLQPAEAASRVRQALRALQAIRGRLVYKKIDSTLHGNLGAEIITILADLNQSLAVVAPAHPRMGRRLIDGQLLLGDGLTPTGRYLPKLLEDQTGYPIHGLPLADIRRGTTSLIAQLERIIQSGGRVVAADTETEDDLTALADAIANFSEPVLPVGSAGLASALVQVWRRDLSGEDCQRDEGDESSTEEPSADHKSVLLLMGSKNKASLAQIETLLTNTSAMVIPLAEFTLEDLDAVITADRHLVVQVNWLNAERDRLDTLIDGIARRRPPGVILTGGDTAELFLGAADVSSLRLTGEISPGVVCSRCCGGPFEGLTVVSKAGGFGEASTLVEATRHLCAAQVRSNYHS